VGGTWGETGGEGGRVEKRENWSQKGKGRLREKTPFNGQKGRDERELCHREGLGLPVFPDPQLQVQTRGRFWRKNPHITRNGKWEEGGSEGRGFGDGM